MNEATFKAYLKKINISNRNNNQGSSQQVKVSLEDIDISDNDLTILKNIRPDARVVAIIKPASEQLSLEDIKEERERNKEEKYKII